MAVTFLNNVLAIRFVGKCPRLQAAAIRSEAHGTAHVLNTTLLREQRDNRVRRFRIEFGGAGVFEA